MIDVQKLSDTLAILARDPACGPSIPLQITAAREICARLLEAESNIRSFQEDVNAVANGMCGYERHSQMQKAYMKLQKALCASYLKEY